ncbi:hypothetical protein BH18THE2_BH18THE2_26680 [soil metagenome]
MKNNLVQQISKPVTSRNSITKYIKNIGIMSKSTAYEYYARLTIFEISYQQNIKPLWTI